ncbi:MAG: hypothetical protein AUF65_02620 [Chloroflexi bacterium 13_1_20CM_50_12]|nr:MAG: hypothetical protein AUF65_02620 [Chloroflexi bacterium 13_1_20CM_50_12]
MKYLNAAEAARALGIGDKTIRRWLKSGRFPSAIVKSNGEYAIPEEEVESLKQHRLKYVHKKTTDQSTDVAALAEKLAALEQEVAELRKGQSLSPEQADIPPASTPAIDAISQTEVAQNRIVERPDNLIPCKVFFEKQSHFQEQFSESSWLRWVKSGIKTRGREAEKFEVTELPPSGNDGKYFFTQEQAQKAVDILRRHGKLDQTHTQRQSKQLLSEGCLLVDTFADMHGVNRDLFQHQIRTGIGSGTVPGEQISPTLSVNESIDYSTHPKLGRYLTPEQQQKVLSQWESHQVAFNQCENTVCWCHTFLEETE